MNKHFLFLVALTFYLNSYAKGIFNSSSPSDISENLAKKEWREKREHLIQLHREQTYASRMERYNRILQQKRNKEEKIAILFQDFIQKKLEDKSYFENIARQIRDNNQLNPALVPVIVLGLLDALVEYFLPHLNVALQMIEKEMELSPDTQNNILMSSLSIFLEVVDEILLTIELPLDKEEKLALYIDFKDSIFPAYQDAPLEKKMVFYLFMKYTEQI